MTHQDREHFGRNVLKNWQLFYCSYINIRRETPNVYRL